MPKVRLLTLAMLTLCCGSAAAADPTRPGTLDLTFGKAGVVRTLLGQGPESEVPLRHAVVLGDGSTLVLTENELLAHLDTRGRLDTAFGTGGVTDLGKLFPTASMFGLTVDQNGRIVLCGTTSTGVLVRRLAPDGTNDADFNRSPVVIVGTSRAYAHAVRVLPGGQIRVLYELGTAPYRAGILALDDQGRRDIGFGDQGTTTLPVELSYSYDVVALPNGAMRFVGLDSPARKRWLLAGVTLAGKPDPALGPAGTKHLGLGISADDLTPGPGSTLFLTGRAGGRPVLAKLTAAGTAIPSFGTGGIARFGGSGDMVSEAHADRQGRIAVALRVSSTARGPAHMGVVRLRPDGTTDRGFGRNGLVVLTRPNRSVPAYAQTAGFDGLGRMVVVGSMGYGLTAGFRDDFGVDRIVVARLRSDRARFLVSQRWTVDRHGVAHFGVLCRLTTYRCQATVKLGTRQRRYGLLVGYPTRTKRARVSFPLRRASVPGHKPITRRVVVTAHDGYPASAVTDVYVLRVRLKRGF